MTENASLFCVLWVALIGARSSERSGALVINIQDDILRLHAMGLLDRLLADKATHGNILWATDAYAQLGEWYSPGNEIRPLRITGDNSDLIKTRARRAMEQRTERTRQHAEVFTPLWVVKKMNDFADEQWFGRKDGIYKYTDDGKIFFSTKKHWKLYVDARRLEITCGEAPFLATRYDVETGEAIPVEERIGLLDRKLRAVSENAQDAEEWKRWALRAVQAIYGYELQGDNLLIARVNILCTVEEHLFHRWRQKADRAWLEKLCNVIAWNLWQMDGIHGCVPVPPTPTEEQLSLFPPLEEQTNLFGEIEKHDIPCRLFDWRGDRSISYTTLREKGTKAMKFDFIIGNPPYQDEVQDSENKTFMPSIYNLFIDSSYDIADRVELIHPARFLYNAGQTPKEWNQKMLSDPHLKVLYYAQDSAAVFPNTAIMGGVVVTYHDTKKSFGAIEVFTAFPELNSILHKTEEKGQSSLSDNIYMQSRFNLEALYADYPEFKTIIGSNGKDKRFRNNIFEKIRLFAKIEQDNSSPVIGITRNKREWRFFPKKYIDNNHENYYRYKVIIPAANGSGAVGEVVPTPLIGEPIIISPNSCYTQSFIGLGAFENRNEAEAALKYVKTKFARVMLGVLKVTQHNPKETWRYVPLQDFTPASDIDWSKSIAEIDQQLYAKYGLDKDEIEFIETHVKEMS